MRRLMDVIGSVVKCPCGCGFVRVLEACGSKVAVRCHRCGVRHWPRDKRVYLLGP
jgi:hypothetical protein